MSSLLFILLGVLVVPLFVASSRLSLASFTAQAFLMMCIAYTTRHGPTQLHDVLRGFDLVLIRGLAVPIALGMVLRSRGFPNRLDLIPPNIFWWIFVTGLILASFSLSKALVPESDPQQTLVAVVAAGVAIGFLILATQPGIVPQVFAVFHIENAIALLELGGRARDHDPILQLVETVVLIVTIASCRWYLTICLEHAPASEEPSSP